MHEGGSAGHNSALGGDHTGGLGPHHHGMAPHQADGTTGDPLAGPVPPPDVQPPRLNQAPGTVRRRTVAPAYTIAAAVFVVLVALFLFLAH